MDLIEAIKSGKPFRRKGVTHWWRVAPAPEQYICTDDQDSEQVYMYSDDILADDWEIRDDRPRLKAYILDDGTIQLLGAGEYPHAAEIRRAPWLDEPEGE